MSLTVALAALDAEAPGWARSARSLAGVVKQDVAVVLTTESDGGSLDAYILLRQDSMWHLVARTDAPSRQWMARAAGPGFVVLLDDADLQIGSPVDLAYAAVACRILLAVPEEKSLASLQSAGG